jgi:hypothetical protein
MDAPASKGADAWIANYKCSQKKTKKQTLTVMDAPASKGADAWSAT